MRSPSSDSLMAFLELVSLDFDKAVVVGGVLGLTALLVKAPLSPPLLGSEDTFEVGVPLPPPGLPVAAALLGTEGL